MNEAEKDNAPRVEADEAAGSSEKPVRPVKMKWGRIVEEPSEESPQEAAEIPPAETKAERQKTPDPRLEALRQRLERERAAEERAKREAEKASAAETETREEEARRRAAAEVRRREEARNAEREAYLRTMQKKRRRRKVKAFFYAILGGLWAIVQQFRMTKKQVLALLLTLVLATVCAVILGNLLKDRVDVSGDAGETSAPTESEAETEPPARGFHVPSVNAGIVSLEGATARSLRSEAQRFASSGVEAVSLILRNEAGALLFSAETDGALGIEGEGDTDLLGIAEILEPFKANGIYVSCLLPMRYYKDGNEYTASVLYAHETALLCEVAAAGADEVVLLDSEGLFEAAESDGYATAASDAVDALSEIAYAVNARAPQTAVGISLSPEFLSTVDSDRYLGEIARAFDLLLLDLRPLDGAEDLYTEISRGVEDHLYFILRYSMRVLIPAGCAEAVTAASVGNWQEGTLPAPAETE